MHIFFLHDIKPKLRSAFNSVGYFCWTSPSWRAASALVTGEEAFSSNERSRSRRELNSDWSMCGLIPPTCFEIALPSLIYNSSLVVSFSLKYYSKMDLFLVFSLNSLFKMIQFGIRGRYGTVDRWWTINDHEKLRKIDSMLIYIHFFAKILESDWPTVWHVLDRTKIKEKETEFKANSSNQKPILNRPRMWVTVDGETEKVHTQSRDSRTTVWQKQN